MEKLSFSDKVKKVLNEKKYGNKEKIEKVEKKEEKEKFDKYSKEKDEEKIFDKEVEDIKGKNDTYISLSFEDIQVNLRLISDLKEGEKLMIKDDRYIVVDDRYGSALRRYISNDSRVKSLDFISNVINEVQKYCDEALINIKNNNEKQNNLERLINIQSLLESTLNGLSRLTETYSNDKLSRAKIETIKKTINTFRDNDLKKALS